MMFEQCARRSRKVEKDLADARRLPSVGFKATKSVAEAGEMQTVPAIGAITGSLWNQDARIWENCIGANREDIGLP